MSEYLEMPWGNEDTIENLKDVKRVLMHRVLTENLDGKGKQDAEELAFDFDRAIEALEKQIPVRQGNFEENVGHLRLSKSGFVYCSVTNKTIRYPLISLDDLECCPRCGQALNWKEEWEKEEWEKEEIVDEECLKCRHLTKDGCDTWCDHGEAFESLN